MSLADDNTGGFYFVWAIQNFSYCQHKFREYFDSPAFSLGTNRVEKWKIRMYPRGYYTADGIAIELCSDESSPHLSSKPNCQFFIRIKSGSFKEAQISPFNNINTILKRHELQDRGVDAFLDEDTLTLRCQMFTVDKSLESFQCYAALTVICVERTSVIWSLDMFERGVEKRLPLSTNFEANVILGRGDTVSNDKFKMEIKQTNPKRHCFLTCEITLEFLGGLRIYPVQDEHFFQDTNVTEVWKPPCIKIGKIFGSMKPTLHIRLAASNGIDYSFVERIAVGEYRNVENSQPKFFDQKKQSDFANVLKDDLRRWYTDGKFSDLIIRTSNKDFTVHRIILCARSEVFLAMFENDTKQSRDGVIHIEDIDEDTLSRMLLFVYTDIVEDLDQDVAQKLYLAADKYIIKGLRRRCSDFLKLNLNRSNACDLLVFVNMHQDEDTKEFVQNFILNHAAEIMGCKEWKRWMKEQIQLASELMHKLCFRNLKI